MGCQSCKNEDRLDRCPQVFDRVHISYLIRGGTRVMWDIVHEFKDPQPWAFQLQVGRTGDQNGDWDDVGLPTENTFYAIDGQQRVHGKTQWTHYRVKLVTPYGAYYSQPTSVIGILGQRDWRMAREIVRKERLRHRLSTQDGYLLKRRFSGLRCTQCVDTMLDESRNPDCTECYGTTFQCGYYYPMDCIWADIAPKSVHKDVDGEGARGTIADVVLSARMLTIPLLEDYDVWVNKVTDDRYYIHRIQNLAEIRGVPLIANVEMRPAGYTDIIYSIPIPQQIEALEG